MGLDLGRASRWKQPLVAFRSFLIRPIGLRLRPRLNRRRARACFDIAQLFGGGRGVCRNVGIGSIRMAHRRKVESWRRQIRREMSRDGVLVEVDTTVGKLAEGSLLLELCIERYMVSAFAHYLPKFPIIRWFPCCSALSNKCFPCLRRWVQCDHIPAASRHSVTLGVMPENGRPSAAASA